MLAGVDVNHAFLLDYYQRRAGGRALDFGCGSGQLVRVAREHALPFFGADNFQYERATGGRPSAIEAPGWVLDMGNTGVPCRDGSFGFICSTEVFEHVRDLDTVARDLLRLSATGARQVHFMPTAETPMEWHCNMPLVHWFPPGVVRRTWARGLFQLGMGSYRDGKTFRQWWDGNFEVYLTQFTTYRPVADLVAILERYFVVRRLDRERFCYSMARRSGWVPRCLAVIARACPERVFNLVWLRLHGGVALELSPRS